MLSIGDPVKGTVSLWKVVQGNYTQLDSDSWALGVGNNKWIIEFSGSDMAVRYEGNLVLSASDSTFADGGVAFGGTGWVDLLSVGYDNNADHDLDP